MGGVRVGSNRTLYQPWSLV